MGVVGAQVSPEAVLIAGIAGAVSGAVSMGAGEFVSV
jgi:VIT1/CCC1 family predicted Fe2+/Mn2+ transporter